MRHSIVAAAVLSLEQAKHLEAFVPDRLRHDAANHQRELAQAMKSMQSTHDQHKQQQQQSMPSKRFRKSRQLLQQANAREERRLHRDDLTMFHEDDGSERINRTRENVAAAREHSKSNVSGDRVGAKFGRKAGLHYHKHAHHQEEVLQQLNSNKSHDGIKPRDHKETHHEATAGKECDLALTIGNEPATSMARSGLNDNMDDAGRLTVMSSQCDEGETCIANTASSQGGMCVPSKAFDLGEEGSQLATARSRQRLIKNHGKRRTSEVVMGSVATSDAVVDEPLHAAEPQGDTSARAEPSTNEYDGYNFTPAEVVSTLCDTAAYSDMCDCANIDRSTFVGRIACKVSDCITYNYVFPETDPASSASATSSTNGKESYYVTRTKLCPGEDLCGDSNCDCSGYKSGLQSGVITCSKYCTDFTYTIANAQITEVNGSYCGYSPSGEFCYHIAYNSDNEQIPVCPTLSGADCECQMDLCGNGKPTLRFECKSTSDNSLVATGKLCQGEDSFIQNMGCPDALFDVFCMDPTVSAVSSSMTTPTTPASAESLPTIGDDSSIAADSFVCDCGDLHNVFKEKGDIPMNGMVSCTNQCGDDYFYYFPGDSTWMSQACFPVVVGIQADGDSATFGNSETVMMEHKVCINEPMVMPNSKDGDATPCPVEYNGAPCDRCQPIVCPDTDQLGFDFQCGEGGLITGNTCQFQKQGSADSCLQFAARPFELPVTPPPTAVDDETHEEINEGGTGGGTAGGGEDVGTNAPTATPTTQPSLPQPVTEATTIPVANATASPTGSQQQLVPTSSPSALPTHQPTSAPTHTPSVVQSAIPTQMATQTNTTDISSAGGDGKDPATNSQPTSPPTAGQPNGAQDDDSAANSSSFQHAGVAAVALLVAGGVQALFW